MCSIAWLPCAKHVVSSSNMSSLSGELRGPGGQEKHTPLKMNGWNIIMEVWKIIFLAKWVICRFHVNLSGCNRLMTG